MIIRAGSPAEVKALSQQAFFHYAYSVDYDMLIAAVDTLQTRSGILMQRQDILDAAYALECLNGAFHFPTPRIFIRPIEGVPPHEVFDRTGLAETIEAVELFNGFQDIYMITLNVRLSDILQVCRTLFQSGLVKFAEPSFIREMERHSNPFFPDQWGLKNIGQYTNTPGFDIRAVQAWNITRGSRDIIVAVIDEGVDLLHPDLQANLLPGFDATVNPPGGANGSPWRNNAHGTAVAGIVAAIDNDIGIVGVAPNVRIVPVRIAFDRYDSGRWTSDDRWIARGIRYAWYYANADVLVNSWGWSESQIITAAIDSATWRGRLRDDGRRLGAVVVFSTGNAGRPTVSFPARLPNVIAVGAMSPCGERKSFASCDTEMWGSNYGRELDVVAPGVLISTTDLRGSAGYNPNLPIHPREDGILLTTDYDDQDYTVWFSGTSAAAPFVAGVAALVLSVNPDLRGQAVHQIIKSTAQRVNEYCSINNPNGRYVYGYVYWRSDNGRWNEQMGHGLVDAYAAVLEVIRRICVVNFINQPPVTTDRTVFGCTHLNIRNITITNGATLMLRAPDNIYISNVTIAENSRLILYAGNEIIIDGYLDIHLGAEFEIK